MANPDVTSGISTSEGSGDRKRTMVEQAGDEPRTPHQQGLPPAGNDLTPIQNEDLIEALLEAKELYGGMEHAVLRIMRLYNFTIADLQDVLKSKGQYFPSTRKSPSILTRLQG